MFDIACTEGIHAEDVKMMVVGTKCDLKESCDNIKGTG